MNESTANHQRRAAADDPSVRDGAWLMMDNVAGCVLALVSSLLVARVLGPTEMGYFNYVLWVAQIVRLVADVGVPLAVRRYVSEERALGNVVTVATIARAAARFQQAVALVVVSLSLVVVFTLVPREQRLYAGIVMLSVAPSLLIGVPASVLWATANLGASVRASLAGTVLNFVLLLAALASGAGLVALALAVLISRCVDLCLRYRAYRRVLAELAEPADRLPAELRSRMVQFCSHQSVLVCIEVVIWNRSELFFLERYGDIRGVAFFSLTFSLVQYVLLLPQVMAACAGADMMARQGRAPETIGATASACLWFVFLVAVPATFGLAAVAGPLVTLMFGAEYGPAIPVLAVLALFGAARALSFPVIEVLCVSERQGVLVGWSLVMVLLNVALGFWLVPAHGAVGAALVKGIVQLLSLAGLWAHAARVVGMAVPVRRAARLVFSSVVMASAVALWAEFTPPLVGLLFGVPLGILVLAVMLRATRALDESDAERLEALHRLLPAFVRTRYQRLIRAVVPAIAS